MYLVKDWTACNKKYATQIIHCTLIKLGLLYVHCVSHDLNIADVVWTIDNVRDTIYSLKSISVYYFHDKSSVGKWYSNTRYVYTVDTTLCCMALHK